jgi:hypothetical protein
VIDNIGKPAINVPPPSQEISRATPPQGKPVTPDTPLPFSVGSTAAGQVAVPDSSLHGTDWNALVDQMSAMNMNVSTSAMMSMLIEVMAQMRQDARASAFDQMQSSLDLGIEAAEKMKDAARKQLTGAITGSAVTIGTGAASSIMSGKAAIQSGTNEALSRATSTNANAVQQVGNSFGSGSSSSIQSVAEMDRADSKIDDAQAQYSESLSQQSKNFMEQLSQSISKALSTMQAVDRAQHEATGAIYGM